MTTETNSGARQVPGGDALRESAEEFKLMVESVQDYAIFMLDPDGRVATWNSGAQRLKGYTAGEIIGKNFSCFYPPEDSEKPRQELVAAAKTGHCTAEGWRLRKDGSRFWANTTITALRENNGALRGFVKITRDMTERKKAEETLRENEQRFRTTMDNMLEGCQILDRDWRYVYINDAAERHNRRPNEELIGKRYMDMWPGIESTRVFEVIRRCLDERKADTFENEFTFPDGNIGWFDMTIQPVPEGVFILSMDVTARKKAEVALLDAKAQKQAAQYTRTLIEVSLDPLVTISAGGKITDVNEATVRATGVSKENLIGTDFSVYFTEPEKASQGYRRVFERGSVNDYPLTIRHKNGTLMYVLYNASVYKDESGNILGVFAAAHDVTAQRQAAWYTRSLIEASPDPLVTISVDGKVTDVNEATVRATGVPKKSLIGTDFSGYFTEPEKASQGYRQVFDRGSVTDYPLTIRHKNGSLMHVLYNASVYKDADGKVLGVFAAARDITARKRIEEELAVHRQHLEDIVAARTAELEAANKDLLGSRRAALNLLKDAEEARQIAEQAEEGLHRAALDLERSNKDLEQFAYVASHDLQEPLRAVGGFMGMLKNQYYDKLDDQAREYIDFSVDGAERMQGLIEGLLIFSRVGTRGGEFAPVNLTDAFDGAVANLRTLIMESHASVTSDPLPVVAADLSQMTQLLQNLVANAVKFHGPHHPEIHVGARRREHAWEIYVRDNGIGIDPQYFERIFMIFQRLHTRTQYKGTGIGLAVCKKIVERHGGKIWVESAPGNGSTFYFTIPDKGEKA